MKSPRYSPQREMILQIVLKEKGHLTAEEIHRRAKKQLPKISLGTVYRNLGTLLEMRVLTQVQGLDQVTHYEPYLGPHHHFICKSCKRIQNLEAPTVKTCTSCISQKTPLRIEEVWTTLFGVCSDCA